MKQVLPFALAALIVAITHADTIRLRNGKTIEAQVLSETNDHYVVLINVTKTIREERRIPKNAVIEVLREKKDDIAFEQLKELVPAPDRLDVDDYDERLGELDRFIETFPTSAHVPQAEAMIKTLEAEREVVDAGGVKFEGELLGAQERQSKAFILDSQLAEAALEDALAKGNRIGALRAWDKLAQEFPTSTAYVRHLPQMLGVMQVQLATIEELLESYDRRIEERTKNLSRVPSKDRDRVRQALESESNAYLQQIAAEREKGYRWLSLNRFEKEPLSSAKSLLESEIRMLETIDLSDVPNGDKAWQEAWETLEADPSPEEANEALSKARDAGLPQHYLDLLEAKAPKN